MPTEPINPVKANEAAERPVQSNVTVALLLAAGRGRRFDSSGQTNKLLALWQGEPVAVHAARHLLEAGLPVVAVIRPDTEPLGQALVKLGCTVTVCHDADLGMGHSLAHGARYIATHLQPQAVLVALADMPFIAPATIRAIAARVSVQQTIVAAALNGKRGHPVAFWASHLEALGRLQGDSGASSLVKNNSVTLIEQSDDTVVRDIDRPIDLT